RNADPADGALFFIAIHDFSGLFHQGRAAQPGFCVPFLPVQQLSLFINQAIFDGCSTDIDANKSVFHVNPPSSLVPEPAALPNIFSQQSDLPDLPALVFLVSYYNSS